MSFQLITNFDEFLVCLRQIVPQVFDFLSVSNTCNHVFTLRVDQVVAVDYSLTRCRVARKSNACA
jgi:hypothetical protein